MSGGSSVPSAPSLGQQVGQANQTFGSATGNAQQTFNTAQAYNNNAQSQLSTALGTINPMSNAIANNANQNFASYQNNFQPLQAQQAQGAASFASPENIQRMQGMAVANTNAGVQAANANAQQTLASEGVDPSSIAGISRANNISGAAQAAGAGTQAAVNTQLQGQQLLNQANQTGLQVGAQGTQGAGMAANTAATGAGITNQTNATGINNMTAANGYLNTANNATQQSTNATQAQFQDQMAAYNAQQQQQAGVGQMIGNVAGIAAMAMMEEGGPVPFDRGVPVYANGGNVSDYAAGGFVMNKGALPSSPIPGSTDTKPALLTPGEFVIPKDVVDFVGQDHFHKMIDNIRNKSNQRRAIPVHRPPHVSWH